MFRVFAVGACGRTRAIRRRTVCIVTSSLVRKPSEAYSPPGIGGEAVPSKDIAEGILCWHGRGGQSTMTTPSAPSNVASQHFLDAQPPLLFQEGNTRSPSSTGTFPL